MNLGYFCNQEMSGLHSRREQKGTEVGDTSSSKDWSMGRKDRELARAALGGLSV